MPTVATFYQVSTSLTIVLVLLAVLSIVYSSWRNGISPMPSSAPVRRVVAAELKRMGSSGLAVEAGSGWGTLALHAARHNPGWRITGVENAVIPLWCARFLLQMTGRKTVSFHYGDLYQFDYRQVDAVICYLYPGAMQRMAPMLREQLPVGARVVSVCFALPGWEAERVVICKDLYQTRVYVY